jgi:hypothetical protein
MREEHHKKRAKRAAGEKQRVEGRAAYEKS